MGVPVPWAFTYPTAEDGSPAEISALAMQRVAGSALDLGRRQIVGLDAILMRFVNGLLRRDPDEIKPGPARLVGVQEAPAS